MRLVKGYIGVDFFFFLMIRRPPRSTQSRSSAASDVYKRQLLEVAFVPVDRAIQVQMEKVAVGELALKYVRGMKEVFRRAPPTTTILGLNVLKLQGTCS